MHNVSKENTFDQHKMSEIAHLILKEAAQRGASEAEVSVSLDKGFSVSAHDGEVETVSYNQDKVVGIHVYFGKRAGTASISDLRPEAIRAAVDAACHIAKFTDEDPYAGLAAKEAMAWDYPQLDLGEAWTITVPEAIELACLCEREAKAYDKRIINAEHVTVSTEQSLNLYANSHGFLGVYPYAHHEVSCVLIAKEKGEMQRDYDYTTASFPGGLHDVKALAREAAERTVRRLGARRLSTRRAPVLFVPEEARGLLGYFGAAISGSNLYRKASFLVDQLGNRLFPDFVHLEEQPHLARALGSEPFDSDGVATRRNVYVEAGVLRSYALGTYSGRKLGMPSTGNAGGMHNLILKPGAQDLAGLMKTMDKGLLITEMMGNGVSVLTGDYSRGASGYWVEHGEIQYPVHEITVAGNLKDIYANMVAVGNDVDHRGNVLTGSILVGEMMIAGDSI